MNLVNTCDVIMELNGAWKILTAISDKTEPQLQVTFYMASLIEKKLNIALNHIVIIAKFHIHKSNIDEIPPNFQAFISYIL